MPGAAGPDADDTIRLSPAARRALVGAPQAPGRPVLGWAVAGLLLLGAGGGVWWLLEPRPAPPAPFPDAPPTLAEPARPRAAIVELVPAVRPDEPAREAPTPPTPAPVLAGPPRLAFAELAAHRSTEPSLWQLQENLRVFILDFPDLETQAAALNRVAAMIEKAGLPRDRVLAPEELAAILAAAGQDPATYYVGHNYRASDLQRFFEQAERQGAALHPLEAWVAGKLAVARAVAPPGELAIVTVPQPGARLDDAARHAILSHEVAHGFFFTDPVFAAAVRLAWAEGFGAEARAALTRFLAAEGYDADNEELLANEAMAYLLFTPDPRFFHADLVGLDAAEVERLRALLRPAVPAALRPLMALPPR